MQNLRYRTAVGFHQRLFIFCLVLSFQVNPAWTQQNTVGLIRADFTASFSGYDLLYPNNQSNVFLIDQCGRIVHEWEDEDHWRPGNVAYLLPDGNLLRAKRHFQSINDPIWFSGGGEIVEMVSWDGEVLWRFSQNDTSRRIHHDIQPMPNGHILLVSWELKTRQEAIEYGRNPQTLLEERLFPDYILEVSPDHPDSVLWEWHAWDHVIQDFDPAKPNFGSVSAHPELINLNHDSRNGIPDWLHINSIDYHPQLDQIMVSVLGFDEIWIIDHSTTSLEASGHSGGRSGKGGDLLYRWGNPQVYDQGSAADQKLFGQHDAQWLIANVTAGVENGDIAVFNNNFARDFSAGHLIHPEFDSSSWTYEMALDQWLPVDYKRTITHPQPDAFQSSSVSSIQLLANGNFLMCAGQKGYTIELNPAGQIVWEYVLPLRSGFPVTQGSQLKLNDNFIFRHKRYAIDDPAFAGKELIPTRYLELDADSSLCDQTTAVHLGAANRTEISVFPNPAMHWIQLHKAAGTLGWVEIYDRQGIRVFRKDIQNSEYRIPIGHWPSGTYLVKSTGSTMTKFTKW